MRRLQAAILGGLVSVAAFCACVCLAMPAVFVAVMSEGDHHRNSPWIRAKTAFIAGVIFGLIAGAKMGWRVGRDWYRNTPPRSRAVFTQT